MESKKHKILVLTDLKDENRGTLKGALNLAKIINADIDLFYVKQPIEVVKKESQLSAMRTINKEVTSVDKRLKQMIEPYRNEKGIKLKSTFAFGNVKTEIEQKIKEVNPDVLVIGKRKSSPLKFLGDGLTAFLLENYQGAVLISTDNLNFETGKELKLGAFEVADRIMEQEFTKKLVAQSKAPMKAFKVVDKMVDQEAVRQQSKATPMIEYMFEQNDNVVSNVTNYLSKNDIDLLLVDRDLPEGSLVMKSQLKSLINKSNVAMLLPGLRKFELN